MTTHSDLGPAMRDSAAARTAEPTLRRRVAGALARSPLFAGARRTWEANTRDWNLPLSRMQKLAVGLHLILRDYERGHFPPVRAAREAAIATERAYRESLPGLSAAAVDEMHLRKPFWPGQSGAFLASYVEVSEALAALGVRPPSRILELGCGSGWMGEMLALEGHHVMGTTISEHDVSLGERRRASLRAKGLDTTLEFRVSAMEEVSETLADQPAYDAAIVYEALHHAYDWRAALSAARACLRDGGWLLICEEPNRVHTYAAYRVATLSSTQEIGFSRRELLRALAEAGFTTARTMKNRLHLGVRAHWVAAQR